MIYSCFEEDTGSYRYFRDDDTLATNADLPVPLKGMSKAGAIGIPAREAARSLPRNVKEIGRGWHAKGVIVTCPNTSFGQEESTVDRTAALILFFAAGFLTYKLLKP